MLTVACMKWGDKYTDAHVLKLQASVRRNTRVPHRFVCITDAVVPDVECRELWSWGRELNGCYRRLRAFSPDVEIPGDRFAFIDLDTVIASSLDQIFSRTEPFLCAGFSGRDYPDQRYNGGFFMMDRGARAAVYDRFTSDSPAIVKRAANVVGTDQAWMRLVLGTKEPTIGPADGFYQVVHDSGSLRPSLPDNAAMIGFAGPRDPSDAEMQKKFPWITTHWTE